MASITELAKMYGQRVPSTSSTGKVGPRQTTANDLRRVATYGRAGMGSRTLSGFNDPRSGGLAPMPSPGSFQMDPAQLQEIQSGLIGGPAAGYGEKYAGFPTRSDYLAAIEGEAIGTRELATLAREQAKQARENRYLQSAPQYVDPLTEELSRSASMAGVRPGATLSAADRARLMGGYEQVQKFGRTPTYLGRLQEETQLGTLRPSGYEQPGMPPENSANEAMRLAYQAMLEAPTVGLQEQIQTADLAASQGLRSPTVSAYQRFGKDFEENAATMYPDIGAPEALANLIGETPLYEYARQIAQARYGMDPAQAAGLFTPEMDISYDKQQTDYERFQSGYREISDAEYIFDNYGPEALEQYRAQKAEETLYGSESEQRTAEKFALEAENLEIDLALENEYGFRPSDIPGDDTDTEVVRALMSDPTFKSKVDAGLARITGDEYAENVGEELGNEYLKETGDVLGATVLQKILVTFDLKPR